MQFEWDEEKNTTNLKKHGVAFEDAVYVFEDKNRIEIYDYVHSINEDRYISIGKVNEVLFVVYTVRYEYIRIISARIATAEEERKYYECKI